jgi:hypothetical protein
MSASTDRVVEMDWTHRSVGGNKNLCRNIEKHARTMYGIKKHMEMGISHSPIFLCSVRRKTRRVEALTACPQSLSERKRQSHHL